MLHPISLFAPLALRAAEVELNANLRAGLGYDQTSAAPPHPRSLTWGKGPAPGSIGRGAVIRPALCGIARETR